MQEIHIVFLYDRELAAIGEYIIILESTLYADEELTFHGTELWTETDAEAAVLISVQTVFVDYAAIPVIAFCRLCRFSPLEGVRHLQEF